MKLKGFIFLFSLITILAMMGCSDSFSNNEGGLYSFMRETTPCIEKGVAAKGTVAASRSVASTDPIYPLFYIFQDYVFPDDEGVIDTGNLYKLLYESSGIYTNRKGEADPITPSQIASPFDFGNALKTYDHAFNSINEQGGNYDYTLAYKITGNDVDSCYGYTVREDYNGGIKTQRQIFETSFNEVSGDVTLDFCTFDDKPFGDSDDFGRRAFVAGNMLDHSFFIHFATGNGSMSSSVVGKGISQGEGYYILCQVGLYQSTYYRLPAGATEGNFETAVGVTNPADLDDPQGYATDIDTYVATDLYTTRCGIPVSLESFTNNGLLVLP